MDIAIDYKKSIEEIDANGEFVGGEASSPFVYYNFIEDMLRLSAIFNKATESEPRDIDLAISSRDHSDTKDKVRKFVKWFGELRRFGNRPIRYTRIKEEIVDREKLFDEREFIRKLNRLRGEGILKKIKYTWPNPENPEKKMSNVYYKVNPDFFEYRTNMDQLGQYMPEILTILARLTFEKNLALGYLKTNKLWSQFEDEKRAVTSILKRS